MPATCSQYALYILVAAHRGCALDDHQDCHAQVAQCHRVCICLGARSRTGSSHLVCKPISRSLAHTLPLSLPFPADVADTIDAVDAADAVNVVDMVDAVNAVDAVEVADVVDAVDAVDAVDVVDTADVGRQEGSLCCIQVT